MAPRIAVHRRRSSSLFAAAALGVVTLAGCTPPESDDAGVEDESGDADDSGETGEPLTATWHQDIAPIVAERCAGCHNDGGIAPFSLTTYDEAAAWAELALQAVEAGQMPPWGQANTEECQPRHGFEGDPTLTDEQVDLLAAWIDGGLEEGDPATAAPLPEAPNLDLEDAEIHLEMDGEIEIGPGSDQYWCYVMDPELDSPAFIDGVQVRAGNEKIVHHVLLYLDETGQSEALAGDDGRYECFGGPGLGQPTLLGAWAPGAPPSLYPEGVAGSIPEGAKLVMNVHYHPTGAVETDAGTGVDIRYATGSPLYLGELALIGNFESSLGGGMGLLSGPGDSGDFPEFRIPAGASGHTETMLFRMPVGVPELKIWSASSHMHYVGTDMLIAIDREVPEASTGIEEECLVQTPRYDFNWQRGYRYDAALDDVPTMTAGDILYMRCTYDNSMSNPYVVEALADQGLSEPVDVYLGEETLDEMCLGVFGVAYSIAP